MNWAAQLVCRPFALYLYDLSNFDTFPIFILTLFAWQDKMNVNEIHILRDGVLNMSVDYTSIAFGRKDGTQISQEAFWAEHADVDLSASQRERLVANVEIEATKFLERNWRRDHEHVRIDKLCACFTFRDSETGELYFTPLYEIDVRVVFRKMEMAFLLIYDLRQVNN